jgi:hypothetical protein
MARTTGLDNVTSLKGSILLAVALLFGGLCISLDLAYPGLQPPVLAVLVFAGSFLVSMAVIASIKIVKMAVKSGV